MRTSFLVDGFNLYHSLREAERALARGSTRWLDLRSMCRSLLPLLGAAARLEEVVYFSALATHRQAFDASAVSRHLDYLECLRSTGVRVCLGRFKAKQIACRWCGRLSTRHEEKESDVALGLEVLDQFWMDRADTVVLVTGDSDLRPAVHLAKRRHPGRHVFCAFPFGRVGFELKSIASGSFRIRAERYAEHQFPEHMVLPDGRSISRPADW